MARPLKVDKILQIVRLKHVVQRWRIMSLRRRSSHSHSSDSDSDSGASNRPTSPGFMAIYVGAERRRFVIPTRYLNLPVFLALLAEVEEVFGLRFAGGLILLCDVAFFRRVLKLLERDEDRFGGLDLDQFVKLIADQVGFDSCKGTTSQASNEFKPFLPKPRACCRN